MVVVRWFCYIGLEWDIHYKWINLKLKDSWTNRALLLADFNVLWKLIRWNNLLQQTKKWTKNNLEFKFMKFQLRFILRDCVTLFPLKQNRQFVVIEIRNLKNNNYSTKKGTKTHTRTMKLLHNSTFRLARIDNEPPLR